MPYWNAIDYPVDKIRTWIAEGKTQQWIGEQIGLKGKNASKLIYKVCKKHEIKCQRTGPRSGAGHPNWLGGRMIDKSGYVLIYHPEHPFAAGSRKSYVREHRLVMEKHLGRYLLPTEVVHHKDHDKQNNALENLELHRTNADHLRSELLGKIPRWTDSGIKRIQEGAKKRHGSHVRLKPDAWQNTQKSDHSIN